MSAARALHDPLRRAEHRLQRDETTIDRDDAGGAAVDRGPLPAGPVGAAADAAPGAERRGSGDAGAGSRRAPTILGHHRRRGQRGRHVLHDVQAASGRGVPRRGLHHGAVRDHGRRRGLRPAARSSRDRQRRDHRRRQDHPGAHRVQRGLRLRTGDDGQLGVLRQHHPGAGDARSSTQLRAGEAGALHPRRRGLHLEARPSGCSPGSPTTAPTRVRPPADRPCWA